MKGSRYRDTYRRAGMTGEALNYACILRLDPCAYCGEAASAVDHIENTAHGGRRNDWANLTGACTTCNGEKQHIPLLHFLLSCSHSVRMASLRIAEVA